MPSASARHATILVSLATILVASCAAPDGSKNRGRRTAWRPAMDVSPITSAEARPNILPETYYSAARLFEARGMYQKAIVQYRKAIAVNHSFVAAYHRLGLLLSRFGERAKATEALARAVELAPDDAVLRNNYGFELILYERWSEAAEQLTDALELRPDFPRARINLGIAQTQLGRFDEALASFRAVLPDADAHYNLGLLYRGQKRYAEAADSFRDALALDPHFGAARKQLDLLGVGDDSDLNPQTHTTDAASTDAEPSDSPAASDEVDAPSRTVDAGPPTVTPFEPETPAGLDDAQAPLQDIDIFLWMFGEKDSATTDGVTSQSSAAVAETASVASLPPATPVSDDTDPESKAPTPDDRWVADEPAIEELSAIDAVGDEENGGQADDIEAEPECHEILLVDQAVLTMGGPTTLSVDARIETRPDEPTFCEGDEGFAGPACPADAHVVWGVISDFDDGAAVATVDDRQPDDERVSSVDAWATLRELGNELAVVRNEIHCLETPPESDHQAFVAADTTDQVETVDAGATVCIDAQALLREQDAELEAVRNDIRCLMALADQAETLHMIARRVSVASAETQPRSVRRIEKRSAAGAVSPSAPTKAVLAAVHDAGPVVTRTTSGKPIQVVGGFVFETPASPRAMPGPSFASNRPMTVSNASDDVDALLSIVQNELACWEKKNGNAISSEWLFPFLWEAPIGHAPDWPPFEIDAHVRLPGSKGDRHDPFARGFEPAPRD